MKKALIAVILGTTLLLSDCASPPPAPDPFAAYISQRQAMLEQRIATIKGMPPGPDKDKALKDAIAESQSIKAAIDRERQIRAMESIARSQARMAEPQPTPYVNPFPTPIQVQIVPNP